MLRFMLKPMFKRLLCMFLTVIMMFSMIFTDNVFAAAATATARTVSIFKAEGSVAMTKGTDKEFKVKEGLNLYDGYTVSTGSNSYCWLKLDDGSLLKMDQNSKVKISKASSKKLSISVLSGGLSVDAEKQKSGNEVEIRVGNTSLAIRGTYFTVESVAGKSAVYTMFEGSGVVDGIDLPSRHIMNVYSRDSKGTVSSKAPSEAAKEELVHELTEFKIDKATSAFVLQTVLDDTGRFIDNGIIKKDDIPEIEKLLHDKLEEIKKRAEAPAYKTYASYYMPGGSGSDYASGYIGTINKSYLSDAINLAKNTTKTTFVNTSSANVFIGFNWVTQAEMNSLNTAISNAEALYNSVTSMVQINNAVTQLFMTLLRFEGYKRQGTKPPTPEIRILQTAIVKASNAKENVSVSVDGSDVYVDSYWVPISDMNAVNTAVADAYDLTKAAMAAASAAAMPSFVSLGSTMTSSLSFTAASVFNVQTFAVSPIEAAAQELSDAVVWFNSAKKPGTKPLDKNKLREAIDHAISVAGNINISTNGYDIEANEYWITKEFHDAFLEGIAYAEEQYNTVTTQHEITLAIYSMNQWVYAVMAGMQWGKSEPAIPLSDDDKYELRRAITDGKDALNGVIKSEGYNIASGKLWVLPWLHDYLDNAVKDAESALSTVKSIGQVYEEANKLDKVLTFFIECTMAGPLTELPLPEDTMRPLLDAVNAAEAAMEGVLVSNMGDDLVEGTRWILTSTFDLLRTEWTYATAALKSGQNVTVRTDALTSAISVFNDCIVTVRFDKSRLLMHIEHASELIADIKISLTGDGIDMGDSESWVTQDAYDEFMAILESAENLLVTAKNQAEIDAAAFELIYAIVKFQGDIQGGQVWLNKRTGDRYTSAATAVNTAASGDTIELTGNGLIPLAFENPLGEVHLNNVNLVIHEGSTLTIDGGELYAFGNSRITNNGAVINGGRIIIGGYSINADGTEFIIPSYAAFDNNGVTINKSEFNSTSVSEFKNNGEFDNNETGTVSVSGSINNNGIVNNYSQNYMAGLVLRGGIEISGWLVNAATGVFNNYSDATIEISGVSENIGEINNFSKGTFIFEDIAYGPLPGFAYVYRNGITIGGIFVNNGSITNNPNGEYAPASINVPVKITEYFTNNGTVNNHSQLTIEGDCKNEKNSRINNSGSIDINNGQCVFTGNAVLVNDGTVNVFYGELKFESNGILTNHGILILKNDPIFGSFNGQFTYESVKPFTNVGDILVFGRFDYRSSAAFTNEGNISVENGSLMVSGMADLVNNKYTSAFFGGTFNFSSSGRLLNNGTIHIYKESVGEPEGSFIYTANRDIANAGEIIMNGSIAVNGGVKLTGEAGAKIVIGESVSGGFRSDFYDSMGIGVTGMIPAGEYTWDGTMQRWVRQNPFEPGEQVLYKEALARTIEDAEFLKGWVVISADGAGLPMGTSWVVSFDMMLLEAAIANAKVSLNAATQAEIDEAEAELIAGIELFTGAIQVKGLEKGALEAAIADAKDAKAEVQVSVTGDGADIPTGIPWVTEASMASLEAFVDYAERILENATTQQELDQWAMILNDTTAGFRAAIKYFSLDKSGLEAAILRAKDLKDSLDPFDFYVFALDFAINKADTAFANASTQQEIEDALIELNIWINIVLFDADALMTAITDAEEILAILDPLDLTAMFLDYAISEAKAAFANALTQDDIDAALDEFNYMFSLIFS